jgi:branched-chain amino acid transport system permease protein
MILPLSKQEFAALAVFFGVIFLSPFVLTPVQLIFGASAAVYAVFALGMCAIVSYAGKLSVAQAVFASVAVYLAVVASDRLSIPFLLSCALAVAAVSILAAALGLVLLRLKGFYFAISTILLSLAVSFVLSNQLAAFTEGYFGLSVPNLQFGAFSMEDLTSRFYLAWLVVLLGTLFLASLQRSRVVRSARAVKADEQAARLVGIRPLVPRMRMFVISAAFAAVAAILLSSSAGFIGPDTFDVNLSLLIFIALVLGGRTNYWGAIVGGPGIVVLRQVLSTFEERSTIAYGVILIAVLVFMPDGVAGLALRLARRLRDKPGVHATVATIPETAIEVSRSLSTESIPDRAQSILRLEGVAVRFGREPVLFNVTCSIRSGSVTALIGPNGAGKTTVLNAISGYIRPHAGTIVFDGRSLVGQNVENLRSMGIARTLQYPYVVPDLLIWENIALGLDFRYTHGALRAGFAWASVRRAEREIRETAIRAAQAVGLGGYTEAPGSQLSFGQRRLLDLARVLVTPARLLLLDEPFAGLSPVIGQTVRHLISQVQSAGTTVMLVDHNLEAITAIADDAVFMAEGRVIKQGSIEALLADEQVTAQYIGL